MNESPVVKMLLAGQDDLFWFNNNLDSLIKKFNNKFIAFKNKEVISSDSNLDNLMINLKQNEIDTSNVIIKFVSKIKSIL
jgi:predicted transport protein